jgi:hypothetical protein
MACNGGVEGTRPPTAIVGVLARYAMLLSNQLLIVGSRAPQV